MSTSIKRIEKEFYLKALFDNEIPLIHITGQTQYVLHLINKPAYGQMGFKVDRPVDGLRIKKNIHLMFDYHGEIIFFEAEVVDIKEDMIITLLPEFLHKNLARSFSRVSAPSDLQVLLTFEEEQYSLSYPRVKNFESEALPELIDTMDPKNLEGVMYQISAWVNTFASGHKIQLFKDSKPSCLEERILTETGKSFYLPSTLECFPIEDPYPKRRLITEDMFKRYLESIGVELLFLDEACSRYINEKNEEGIFSDLWVPILFREYVVGYIHIWMTNNEEGALPFDYGVIDSLYQFAKVLAYSLKINGFFDSGKLKKEPFIGYIIDVSASGLLFTHPDSSYAMKLLPETRLSAQLKTNQRTINTKAKVVRQYKSRSKEYYGCNLLDMASEDLRFLFEYIYGRAFSSDIEIFFSGQV
jgi:hypothetical protein